LKKKIHFLNITCDASLSRISIPINFQSVSPSSIKPSTPTILTGIIEPVA
jgi:hypothetical protein